MKNSVNFSKLYVGYTVLLIFKQNLNMVGATNQKTSVLVFFGHLKLGTTAILYKYIPFSKFKKGPCHKKTELFL